MQYRIGRYASEGSRKQLESAPYDANRGWQAHGGIGVTGFLPGASKEAPTMARHKKGKAMVCGLVRRRVAVREARDANPGAAIERHGGDYLVLRVGRQETWG